MAVSHINQMFDLDESEITDNSINKIQYQRLTESTGILTQNGGVVSPGQILRFNCIPAQEWMHPGNSYLEVQCAIQIVGTPNNADNLNGNAPYLTPANPTTVAADGNPIGNVVAGQNGSLAL